jgi:hypothetical protein
LSVDKLQGARYNINGPKYIRKWRRIQMSEEEIWWYIENGDN